MKAPSQSPYPAAGFTLIELLASMGVIAILASILIVGIGKARLAAAENVSRSNLRQLGSMILLYTTEADGRLPYGAHSDPEGKTQIGWDQQIINAGIADEADLQAVAFAPNIIHDNQATIPRSYSMVRTRHAGVGMTVYGDDTTEQLPVSRIPDPAKVLMLTEKFVSPHSFGGYAHAVIDTPDEQVRFAPERTEFNYLFVDGHVETLEPNATIGEGSLKSPKGIWTIDPTD
ncbi:type II secretion system protein [Rubellicoccus peritrichatus]|uniref:Type II secretion system protein n=1 Tax=Rubellicoccus peritrichatus TaxID=3080537 RepID=A0AAQ3QS77_9BACT|nr:type II secretion system protein [Puniceicoccus sp. CR14]WOO40066.1 type II secretion system protein [Puniceicoccus sp. CR14]